MKARLQCLSKSIRRDPAAIVSMAFPISLGEVTVVCKDRVFRTKENFRVVTKDALSKENGVLVEEVEERMEGDD